METKEIKSLIEEHQSLINKFIGTGVPSIEIIAIFPEYKKVDESGFIGSTVPKSLINNKTKKMDHLFSLNFKEQGDLLRLVKPGLSIFVANSEELPFEGNCATIEPFENFDPTKVNTEENVGVHLEKIRIPYHIFEDIKTIKDKLGENKNNWDLLKDSMDNFLFENTKPHWDTLVKLEEEIRKIKNFVFNLPGYAGGIPITIQEPDAFNTFSYGPFIMQINERLVNVNLGDSGNMYLFAGGSYWDCY